MAKSVRKFIDDGSAKETVMSPLAPRSLTKQEFAKRLYNLMIKRGWNQAELGRQAGLPRDAISTYIRGKVMPEPVNLKKLADVFGMKPEELLPNMAHEAIAADETPAFEMKVSPTAPGFAWVRVNRLVKTGTAMKIGLLLDEDDAFNREGSGSAAAV